MEFDPATAEPVQAQSGFDPESAVPVARQDRPDFIPKQTDYAAREEAARARGVVKTSLSDPMIELPQLPELKGTPEEPLTGIEKVGSAAAGVYNEGAKLISSFTSPANVAIALTTGGIAKAAQAGSVVARRALVGVGAYFAGSMGKDAIEQIPEAKKVFDNPDASPQEKAAAVAAPALTASMGILAALGAVHEARPDLTKILRDKTPQEAEGVLRKEASEATPDQGKILTEAADKIAAEIKFDAASAEPVKVAAESPAGPRNAEVSTGNGVETPFEEKMIAEWKQQIAAEQSGAPEVGLGAASPKEFQPAEKFTTSLKKSVREDEAAARGETLPEPEEAKAAVKLWEEAKAVTDENPGAADEILAALKEKPRALNDVEVGVLLQKKVDLTNEFNRAHKNITEGTGTEDSLKSDAQIKASALEGLNRIEESIGGGARETGRGLNAFKLMADQDFSLAKMLTDMRREKGGRALTEPEIAEVETFHKQIESAKKAKETGAAEQEAKTAESAADEAVADIAKEVDAAGTEEARDTNAERAGILDALKKLARETPDANDVHLIRKLAENFVREGVKEREPLIDAVHGAIKDIIPGGITRRQTMDAISGYGEFRSLDQDAVKAELRDLKGQMQQVGKLQDMEAGKAPSKTGSERRTPSDEERALIKQVEEAKRKGGFKVTDPAKQLKTALDSIKTRLTNAIKDLETQIASKTKIVRDKTSVKLDDAAEALKKQRDLLQEEFDKIFGDKKLTDAQRIEIAKKSADRQIAELERQLRENEVFPKGKKPVGPTSPELDAKRAQIEALKEEREYARVSGIDPEIKIKKTPEEISLQAFKMRLANRIADIRTRLANGDFSPKAKPKTIQMDEQARRLDVTHERAKKLYQEALATKRMESRNWFQKTTSWIANLNRVSVLSHLSVLEHLTGAAIENVVTRPVGTAFSQLMRLNGTLDSIRQKAVYEGGIDLKSEFKGLTGMLKSSRALWEKLTTGKSDIDWLHKDKVYPKRFGEIVGNVHGAIKEPVRQGIYARSMELRTKAAEAKGLDPAHDEVLAKVLSAEAYRDANMDIFMGDNFLSKALHGVVTGYLRGEKSSPGLAKFTADVLDIMFPVVNVTTNLAIRKFRLLAGLPEAGVRIGVAKARGELKNGAEKLTEQEAERITRAMKYGAFGTALGIYAWNHPDQFGGIYVSGKQAPRDKKNKLGLGEIALPDGGHISHHLAHGPVGGYMNMMADARRLYDLDVKGKKDSQWGAMSDAAFFAMFAGTKDLPAFSNVGRLASPYKSAGQKAGEMVRQMFINGAVQDVAAAIDPATGRKTKTFADELKVGIPKVRETLPAKR